MESLSGAKSTVSQCFICRQWSWDVCRAVLGPRPPYAGRSDNVTLCMPCYVDVLEVRQARGVMGPMEPDEGVVPADEKSQILGTGNSPSPPDPLQWSLFGW